MYIKFKTFLILKKIKQKEVAEYLKINKSTFSKKINQQGSDFNLEEVRKICKKYDLNSNIFMDN